jgi:Helix-turn-helix domain
MSQGDDELLTLAKAAEIAKYKPTSLRNLALKGEFPAKKVGRDWVITRERLEAWMKSPHYHPGGGGRPKETFPLCYLQK